MSEPTKQQMGDGQDNYGQAAKQARNAAKNIGKRLGRPSRSKRQPKVLKRQSTLLLQR